jgi:hypothetical protein
VRCASKCFHRKYKFVGIDNESGGRLFESIVCQLKFRTVGVVLAFISDIILRVKLI